MAQVQADLNKVAVAADKAAGRYTDSQGKMREANGRFVSSATLAAEAAARLGGSLGTVSDAASKAGSSINSGLVAGFASFDAKVKPLNEGVGRLGEGLKGLGGGLTAGVTIPLGLLGGASLKMAGDLEVAKVAFTTMLGSAEAATQTLEELKQFAADTPFEFPEIQDAARKLLAFNTPAAELKETLRQLGDISAGIGAPIGEISELFGKARVQGRLFQEDINQLTGRGIPIIQELAKQFGVTDDAVRKLVESGKVNFGNLQTAFADLTKEGGKFGGLMAAQSETIPGLFSTLSDNAGQALASLGQDIAKSLNLKGIITDLSAFVKSAADAFRSLSPGAKDFAIAAGVVTASLGPIAFALGSVLTILPQLEAGLAVLGLEAGAALAPILPIAAAVAAGIYLIYTNFDAIKAFLQSGEVSGLFADIADSAGSAADSIGDAFATLRANVGGSLGDIVSAGQVFSTLFREIAVGIAAAFDVVGGLIKAVNSAVTGDFSSALDGAQQALQGLIAPLANLFGYNQRPPTDSGVYVLAQHAKEFNAVGPQLAANLALLNNVQLGEIAKKAADAAKGIGLLAELEERLKAAKDGKAALTSEADIANSNRLIASLESQIKRLNELGVGSKKASEAVAKLRAELAGLSALDSLLGDTPDQVQVLERRTATLTSGLKALVDAGVSPGSIAFRGFVADLVNTGQALDRLRGAGQALDLKPVDVKSLIPQTIGDTLPADVARLLGDYAKQAKPFELPVAVRLKFEATISPGDQIKSAINSALLDIGNGFRTADASLQVFGNSFDAAQAKVSTMGRALQDLLAAGVSPLNPAVVQLGEQFRAMSDLANINTAATSALTSGLTQLATGLLEGIGQLAAGSIGLEQFGASILGLIGKLATQVGEAIISVGVGLLALKFAFTNPFAAIAAGAALVLVGSALGAISSSLGSVGTGSGGGSVSAPQTNYSSNAPNAGQQTLKVVVDMKLRGQDLVAVQRLQDYRVQRTG